MKRLLLVVALLLIPAALLAQGADRDILLTSNGTLYTIESRQNDTPNEIDSARYLTLTIQNGQNVIKTAVPASLTGGNNWEPALAFDSESNTLFVFWLHSPNTILGANELLFCTFQNGRWGTPTSVEDVPYHFRYNLRVGVTRSVQVTEGGTGLTKQVPGLTVHAFWWDDSAAGELARYAMLTIERGVVTAVAHDDLINFINTANLRNFELDEESRQILRHPVVFESAAHDTIDVVFGNMITNTMHRLTLKPVLQSRVRIPIGVRDTSYPVPRQRMQADAQLGGISSLGSLALYYTKDGEIRYLTFENGAWSAEKTIALTNEVSADAAVAAIRRMVSGD